MNLDDYKFVYKPSISIIMREFALDFRISALGIKLAGHTLGQTVRHKFPSGGPVGVHNSLHERIGLEKHEIDNIYNVMGVPRHMMEDTYRKVGNIVAYCDPAYDKFDESAIICVRSKGDRFEANAISNEQMMEFIKLINENVSYKDKPTIWQRIKSIFRSW